MEEINNLERVYHSYDEWQNGTLPWGMWGWGYGEEGILHKPEMVTKIHVLPKSEYDKILSKQAEILADHIKKNLDFYVQRFEERLKAPGDEERRIEDEIQEVDKILTDKALTYVPVWYNEGQAYANGSVVMSPDHGQLVSPDFKNEIAYWYYKIIIRADPENEPRKFIFPEDEGNYLRYIPQVVVLTLYEYRQYLLNLTNFDIDKFTFQNTPPPPGKVQGTMCCPTTDKIFEGLRKYKPSRKEFYMFKDAFNQHPFANNEWLQNDLPGLIDEIFERVSHLRSDLQAYFLEQMEKDVVNRIGENETLVNECFKFQKMFKQRMKELQDEEKKRLQENENSEPIAEHSDKIPPGFTTAQSVLVLFYLLKAASFDRGKAPDTHIAEFIQLITGKEANTKVKDTTILKRWRTVIDERQPLNAKDLETVQAWFEKIGLDGVAQIIGERKKRGTSNKD